MSCNVAVDVYCYGKSRDVSGELFNVYCQCCCSAAEALGADAESVDLLKELFLKVSIEGILVSHVNGTEKSLLCKVSSLIECAADTYADNDGRTGIGACFLN